LAWGGGPTTRGKKKKVAIALAGRHRGERKPATSIEKCCGLRKGKRKGPHVGPSARRALLSGRKKKRRGRSHVPFANVELVMRSKRLRTLLTEKLDFPPYAHVHQARGGRREKAYRMVVTERGGREDTNMSSLSPTQREKMP